MSAGIERACSVLRKAARADLDPAVMETMAPIVFATPRLTGHAPDVSGKLPVGLFLWRPGPLGDTAFEVLEITAHLFEGKSECEEMLGLVARQTASEAFASKGGNLVRIVIKRTFDGFPGGSRPARQQRCPAATEVTGKSSTDLRQRCRKPRRKGFRKRHGGCSPDDHQVMAETEKGAQQRSSVWRRG
jgi:hypothetical protein